MKARLLRHLQVLISTIGDMARNTVGSLMSISVIAISLALPGGLYLLIENLGRVTEQWDASPGISLFLAAQVPEEAGRKLATQLHQREGIEHTSYISPAEALASLTKHPGFKETTELLDENPLPPVIAIRPGPRITGPELKAMADDLAGLPEVDQVVLDMEWVERFQGILDIARRGLQILSALLALAVILVIGNTIRLAILNRKEEIAVTKLVGGTDGFIRRPFLYFGALHGFCGGLLSRVLLGLAVFLLNGPANRLAASYGSSFSLQGLGVSDSLSLLAGATLLGIVGAWISVYRHLREIEPE